jgi:hypothetical protein
MLKSHLWDIQVNWHSYSNFCTSRISLYIFSIALYIMAVASRIITKVLYIRQGYIVAACVITPPLVY